MIKFCYMCRHKGCPNPYFWSYSEKGLDILIRLHEADHFLEIQESMKRYDEQNKFKNKDYNKLYCNWQDILFLKTRGISIDEDIIYVGKGSEH